MVAPGAITVDTNEWLRSGVVNNSTALKMADNDLYKTWNPIKRKFSFAFC